MNTRRFPEAYAVWRIRDFRFFILGRFFITLAIQMQSVIVGWQIYDITHDPFSLGLIGLAEFIPFVIVALPAGFAADRIRRKNIVMVAVSVYFIAATLLFLLSGPARIVIDVYGSISLYAVIVVMGFSRGFYYTAQSAWMAQIVSRSLYTNSSTWNSIVWHLAAISGPAAGGLIYAFAGIGAAYMAVMAGVFTGSIMFMFVSLSPRPVISEKKGMMKEVAAGLRFVFSSKIIRNALALDMLAVLFGDAVVLLPVFASEILQTGPEGLGLLRAAPAFGAVAMSLFLAYHPPTKKSGIKLLGAVALFGICFIAFALSENFWLSFALLVISGVFDNVSVVIRLTVLQLFTPDEMRGRVAAVNSLFIGSANELGSFVSGSMARIMGLIPSVIFGGIMTVGVAGSMAAGSKQLRKMELRP